MNYKECEIIASELNAVLSGSKFQKVKENENGDFYLSFYKSGTSYDLLLTVNPPYPRIYLTTAKPAKSNARNFTMYLRKHVIGKIVESVNAIQNERVVQIKFNELKLVAELFPRGGNVYVLNHNNNVLYSLIPVDFEVYSLSPAEKVPEIDAPDIPADRLYNEVLDEKYSSLIEEKDYNALKSRVVKMLNKEKKRAEKKLVNVKKDLNNSEKAGAFQKYGDLIKTYFYDIKKGMKEYTCIDHEAGENVKIPLDTKLSAEENMKMYYKKAKKIKQGREYVESNVKRAEQQLKTITRFYDSAQAANDLFEINSLLDNMQKNKFLRRVAGNVLMKKGKAKEQNNTPYRSFSTESGHEIFIGRSDEENDKLTFTFANGRDLWFHVADYAGSHIVVPVKTKDEEIDIGVINDAGLLAVHYSKAKGMDADVHYTLRKFVTKSKGMPKGMVNVSKFKTLFVKYDKERIRDLMEMNK